jgi:murein DD-endopeptidase MepM/ murein hydrolase activator NlpD
MATVIRRLLAPVLAVLLLVAQAGPAGADEQTDALRDALTTLSAELDAAARLTKRLTLPEWDPAVARAVRMTGIGRLEQALAAAEVEAAALMGPLIGDAPPGAVPAAVTAALWTEDPDDEWRRGISGVVDAWRDYRRSAHRATLLSERLRTGLGLPIPHGLRVCPLEHAVELEEDWGDLRRWRTHKGNDVNAAEGTRLVAMEMGEVIQLGYHYLGGDGLYLRGDLTGDVYYYAHLSAYADGIEVGTPVIAGQVVAYVGSTGNADVPHLHLGWMPAAGRVDLDALTDAYELLRGLCD